MPDSGTFPITVAARSGPATASVRVCRAGVVPCWEVDFHNGYIYFLVYYGNKWGAIEGVGPARPTRKIVEKLAKQIAIYLYDHRDEYRQLVKAADGGQRWDIEHPILFDYGKLYNPPVHQVLGAQAIERYFRS
ncbi:MAG: hypothetical protein EOP50_14585 [Sphingobacteriales bacterium]|nr:MAG: hypothetical protein EOP50_14585 [Sphingobacteriales bacterium]